MGKETKALHTRKIYLAGGFKSGWQDHITKSVEGQFTLDPRKHDLKEPSQYVPADLLMIDKCDILVANVEPDNPGLYALCSEVGYAKAKGKIIIWVEPEESQNRYFDFSRHCATVRVTDLEKAVEYLRVSKHHG